MSLSSSERDAVEHVAREFCEDCNGDLDFLVVLLNMFSESTMLSALANAVCALDFLFFFVFTVFRVRGFTGGVPAVKDEEYCSSSDGSSGIIKRAFLCVKNFIMSECRLAIVSGSFFFDGVFDSSSQVFVSVGIVHKSIIILPVFALFLFSIQTFSYFCLLTETIGCIQVFFVDGLDLLVYNYLLSFKIFDLLVVRVFVSISAHARILK